MKRIVCLAILLLAQISHAQNGPTKADFILLAANTTIRSLDAYSTRKGLEQGAREVSLPQAIAGSTPAMWAYSLGVVAADWLVSRTFERHGHPRIAHLITGIDISYDAYDVANNFRILQ